MVKRRSVGVGLVGLLVLVVSVVVLGLVVWFGVLQSGLVFGEEGFVPYDPLLLSGSFDRSLWSFGDYGVCSVVKSTWMECGYNWWGGCPDWCRSSALAVDFYGVSASSSGGGSISISPVAILPTELRTKDLRLKDFRMEYISNPRRCGSNSGSFYGTGVYLLDRKLGVPRSVISEADGARLVDTFPTGWVNGALVGWVPRTVEVKWSDYALGEYQVKVNGVVVERGFVPEGEEFILFTRTFSAGHIQDCTSGTTLINPRVKEVFGCDPKGGEYLASMTFKGFTTVNVDNLVGFRRFCVEHPSVFLKDGVSASSVQVMYELAQGKTVAVQENELRKIFYIADGRELGITQACEDGAFDVTTKRCGELTGIVDICPADAVLVGNQCVSFVENVYDIEMVRERVEGSNTIWWNANSRSSSLRSGGTVLFEVAPPNYLCRDSDGHRRISRFSYPNPSADCYQFVLNGQVVGAEYSDRFFTKSIGFSGLFSYYEDNDGNYFNGVFRERDWNYQLKTVVGELFTVSQVRLNSTVLSGDAPQMRVVVRNEYGKPLDARVAVVFKPAVIRDVTTLTREVTAGVGDTVVSFTAPSGYVGRTDFEVFVVLRTSAGDVVSSRVATGQYVVEQRVVNNEVVKVVQGDERLVYLEVPSSAVVPVASEERGLGVGFYIAAVLVMVAAGLGFYVLGQRGRGRRR